MVSEFDPFDVAGQEAEAEARRADALNSEATEEGDLNWLMADPRGRRIARRLLERTGVFRSTFDPNERTASFREGERNIGLWLVAAVTRSAPHRLADLLIEGADERRDDRDDQRDD